MTSADAADTEIEVAPMRTPPTFLFGIAALAILLSACSTPTVPGPDTADDTQGDAAGDLIPDLPAEIEDTGPDLPEVDAEAPDAGGGYLDPCAEDEDCLSGYCVAVGDGLACTTLCEDADCPDATWDCVEMEGGDLVCLPPCVPDGCEALGAECGAPEDGCGGFRS